MKQTTIFLIIFLLTQQLSAQNYTNRERKGFPVNLSVFTQSIGFPNFRSWGRHPEFGLRVGTEFYYRQSEKKQLHQTVQSGYYKHQGFHQAFFLSSEFGYRRYFGNIFADATVGLGYMLIDSALPRFEPTGDHYSEQTGLFGRLIPNVGLGAGYRFQRFSVFSRYEMFGEFPFGLKEVPALPHSAFHVGTRFSF